jgi:hypothetical protein
LIKKQDLSGIGEEQFIYSTEIRKAAAAATGAKIKATIKKAPSNVRYGCVSDKSITLTSIAPAP